MVGKVRSEVYEALGAHVSLGRRFDDLDRECERGADYNGAHNAVALRTVLHTKPHLGAEALGERMLGAWRQGSGEHKSGH